MPVNDLSRLYSLARKLPQFSFAKAQQKDSSLFRVQEIKQSVTATKDEETAKLRQLIKKREDFLAEANVSFYELEINIDFYYQNNTFNSMYLKNLLDFSNINYAGVS